MRRAYSVGLLALCGAALAVAAAAWWWFGTSPRPADFDRGFVSAVAAGDGIRGTEDGPADRARFAAPFGVAVLPEGAIAISDGGSAPRIRLITADRQVTTLAGSTPGFTDGSRTAARFETPSGIAAGRDGSLYVADTGNHAIRRVTPDGVVTTVAGDGQPGDRDGRARDARFNGPVGLAIDASGAIIVADTYNDRIRVVSPAGDVVTLAGGAAGPGSLDGPAGQATFDTPCGVAVDSSGRIYVADTGNGRVRLIEHGLVSTIGAAGEAADVGLPMAIALAPDGALFVSDERGRVVRVEPATGAVSVIAGSTRGFADGPGAAARFRSPAGIAWHSADHFVVADAGNALVRDVVMPSRLGLRPPASPRINPRFDEIAFGSVPLLWPVRPMGLPHEVAGTLGEARGDLAEGGGRFHAGIDVKEAVGTPVLAVRDMLIESPIAAAGFGSLNESLTASEIAYIHIRAGRDAHDRPLADDRFIAAFDAAGAMTGIRVRRGARFQTGDTIGTVNRFSHVHLNVGWPGEEVNPLGFRVPGFSDRIPPTIAASGVRLFSDTGEEFTAREHQRILVSGAVHAVVDAWDRADLDAPRRRLGVYRLGYQVLDAASHPLSDFERPLETMRFDRLAPNPDAPALVYAPGTGIPFYGARRTRFLYQVTNSYRDGRAAPGAWDTSRLGPGDYVFRAIAGDIAGNETTADVAVRIQ